MAIKSELCMIGVILSILIIVKAQTCHKLCKCKEDKVECVGTNATKINVETFVEIIAWTPVTTTEFTVYDANLTTVSNVFTKFTQLQKLTLVVCNITNIASDAFSTLKTLTEIHISDNPLKTLQGGAFRNLTNLKIANFSHNPLESLPQNSFQGLTSLKELYIGYCNITKLDSQSFHADLRNLETLFLSYNALGTIANDTFNTLTNLKHLDLGFQSPVVKIEQRPFSQLKNLESLILVDVLNHTTETGTIPLDLFAGLDKLLALDIRKNNLKSLKREDLKPISKTLKILHAGLNHFKTLSNDTYHDCENLEELDLYHSYIERIENGTFEKLINLKKLDLESNRLQNLSTGVLNPVKNATIHLRHNLFRCDCYMLDMLSWMQNNSLVFNLTCAFPLRLRRQILSKLTPEKMGCAAPDVFNGHNESEARAEAHMSVTWRCHARSYDRFANMSYAVAAGNPVPQDLLVDVEERKRAENFEGETVYYTELRINLREIQVENSGRILCKATNSYGTSSGVLIVTVFPQRWGMPLWAFVLVIIIIFIIVFLCIALLVYYYKYKFDPVEKILPLTQPPTHEENFKPMKLPSITSSTVALHPEPVVYDRGEYNVAYLEEAPSMYVTYV